jgi:DNA primase
MTGRWHCFACQAGGDAIALVQAYAQVGFREAVDLIEAGGKLPRGADPHLHLRPANRTPGGALSWEAVAGPDREPPDLARTPAERLYEAMAVAWRYYSLDGLTSLARRRLAERSIDLGALEAREARPLAGHTPRSRTGLVDHLRRRGFVDNEAVDAGLASRYPNGRVEDFFTHRLVLPVRDSSDRVVGLIGRDVSGGLRAKYLNTPKTNVYDKSSQLYRARGVAQGRANLVVVEGAIDAIAIDAYAAQAGMVIMAVSPSGVALTAKHRAQVTAWAVGPAVLCADGDAAGRAATRRWVTDMTLEGREVLAALLPDQHDPADWLGTEGVNGLDAFLGTDPLRPPQPGEVRPLHAGRYLARALAQEHTSLSSLMAALAQTGGRLSDVGAQRQFTLQATRMLAVLGLGPDGWLERHLVLPVVTPWPPGGNGVKQGNRGLAI